MSEKPKQRWGCLQWGIVTGVVLLLASLFVPVFKQTAEVGVEMQGVMNCKQIILALKLYAKDAGSGYPDQKHPELQSANQVFRELFKAGIVSDERIFGCPKSLFLPDNRIGEAPGYEQALSPGECHWMLVKNQSADSAGNMPLVLENSSNASWPPKWEKPSSDGLRKRGEAWQRLQIIVGRNDGSAQVEKLRPDGTPNWPTIEGLYFMGRKQISGGVKETAPFSYWDIEGR